VDPALFLADLEAKPESLAHLADALEDARPFAQYADGIGRILLLGMGSSAYAGVVAAARLRHLGIAATCELASTDLLPPATPDLLVIALSASGSSPETLAALEPYRGQSRVVAVTQDEASAVVSVADHVVPLLCGPELGGVACRSFQHTQAVLLALEAELAGRTGDLVPLLHQTIEATSDLLERRDSWLPEVAHALDGPDGVYVAAPARRFSSAQQSALMVREGPRRAGVACETGDWNHVDVYLTKTLDYRMLLLPGSLFDAELLGWTSQRGSTVVSVGADVEEATHSLRYRRDDVDDVRLLTEVLVAELVAQRWWAS
jgi:glucosamine--fructose-6-phosphate aminotransferase (isomerizing)